MLSFFRKKSLEESNQPADKTIPSTSSRSNSISDMQLKDSDALVRELGYNNLTELKETIYGNAIQFIFGSIGFFYCCYYQICYEPSKIPKNHQL